MAGSRTSWKHMLQLMIIIRIIQELSMAESDTTVSVGIRSGWRGSGPRIGLSRGRRDGMTVVYVEVSWPNTDLEAERGLKADLKSAEVVLRVEVMRSVMTLVGWCGKPQETNTRDEPRSSHDPIECKRHPLDRDMPCQ